MGKDKGTDNLIDAVEELQKDYPQLKLVLFGRFDDEETQAQANHSLITLVYGWCNRVKTLELLKMADVACWPIHHTTLIEDAVSVRTPLILRKTGTTEHLIDGNGVWVENGTKEEIKKALVHIIAQNELEKKKMFHSCEKMKQIISYHTISKKVINDVAGFR